MGLQSSVCWLGKLSPDGKGWSKCLEVHCGDIERGESVNDSNLDSRVIWLVSSKACDAGIFWR